MTVITSDVLKARPEGPKIIRKARKKNNDGITSPGCTVLSAPAVHLLHTGYCAEECSAASVFMIIP